MRRPPARLLPLLVLSACRPAPPSEPLPGARALEPVAWISGRWLGEQDGVLTEEVWTAPGGGVMHGLSRSITDGKLVGWELLELQARGEAIVYVAHPEGRMPGTEFVLRDHGAARAGEALFENPTHDFPTRLIYRQVGDRLHARVENDERGFVLEFRRRAF